MNIAIETLKDHPASENVPKMRPGEWEPFLADVLANGVREPIVVQKGGVLLDGRHRVKAAKIRGDETIPAITVELSEKEQVDRIVKSAILRRHLNDDQRAILARRFQAPVVKANAIDRASKAGSAGGKGRPKDDSLPHNACAKLSKDSRDEVAEMCNVPRRKVDDATFVEKHDSQLAQKVFDGEVPLKNAKRQIQKEQSRKKLTEKAKAAPKQPDWEIIEGDCVRTFKTLDDRSARLIFADPPYNIGIDYGGGAKADKLDDTEYMRWVSSWLEECWRVLKDDGSLWVMIGDEYAAEYAVTLKKLGFTIRSWVKWYETFGVNCANNFNRTSRHIFYAVANPKKFVFNVDAVSRPSDRQTKYGDKRAAEGGKIWDDVWQISRVTGTSTERIPDFPTQLPLAITRAIVGCASEPGDLVIDPFNGSGSTGVAAIELGRKYLGMEKSSEFCRLAKLRLHGIEQQEDIK